MFFVFFVRFVPFVRVSWRCSSLNLSLLLLVQYRSFEFMLKSFERLQILPFLHNRLTLKKDEERKVPRTARLGPMLYGGGAFWETARNMAEALSVLQVPRANAPSACGSRPPAVTLDTTSLAWLTRPISRYFLVLRRPPPFLGDD